MKQCKKYIEIQWKQYIQHSEIWTPLLASSYCDFDND